MRSHDQVTPDQPRAVPPVQQQDDSTRLAREREPRENSEDKYNNNNNNNKNNNNNNSNFCTNLYNKAKRVVLFPHVNVCSDLMIEPAQLSQLVAMLQVCWVYH